MPQGLVVEPQCDSDKLCLQTLALANMGCEEEVQEKKHRGKSRGEDSGLE